MRLDMLHQLAYSDTADMSQLEADYVAYCRQAVNPAKRDYNFLREILRCNIGASAKFLVPYFQMLLERQMKNIRTIYDLGAGHTAWADIFREAFPLVNIVLVDKDPIDPGPYTFHQSDVAELLDGNSFNYTDLLWFSEFFHCKEANLNMLRHTQNAYVMINELMWNEDIDRRLRQTGGCLYTSRAMRNLLEADEAYFYNTPLFPYYLLTREPA